MIVKYVIRTELNRICDIFLVISQARQFCSFTLPMKCSKTAEHWVLAGVAIVLDIRDASNSWNLVPSNFKQWRLGLSSILFETFLKFLWRGIYQRLIVKYLCTISKLSVELFIVSFKNFVCRPSLYWSLMEPVAIRPNVWCNYCCLAWKTGFDWAANVGCYIRR